MKEICRGIYKCDIYIDANYEGVRNANVFLIPSNCGRHLIIDAGFNCELGIKIIESAMEELNMKFEDTDVFISHRHHDHVGLCGWLYRKGATIYMNSEEERHPYDCIAYKPDENTNKEHDKVLASVGIDKVANSFVLGMSKRVIRDDMWFLSIPAFPYIDIKNGKTFNVGEYEFETLILRGHTYGQMGLIDRKNKILFSADQLIDGVSPIVATTYFGEGLLNLYINSLKDIQKNYYNYKIIPSHGEIIESVDGATSKILMSYSKNINRVLKIVKLKKDFITVKEAACLKDQGARELKTLKQFVDIKMILSKTFSILEYLACKGCIRMKNVDGVYYFKYVKRR